jgi:hypothetical protein
MRIARHLVMSWRPHAIGQACGQRVDQSGLVRSIRVLDPVAPLIRAGTKFVVLHSIPHTGLEELLKRIYEICT